MTPVPWHHRLWPRDLASRTVLLLLVSLTVFHLGSLWLHQHGAAEGSAVMDEVQVAGRAVSAAKTIAGLAPDERNPAARSLSDAVLGLDWSELPVVEADGQPAGSAFMIRLLTHLVQGEPGFAVGRFAQSGVAGAGLRGSLRLPDGTWLNLLVAPMAASSGVFGTADTIASTSVMAVGIVAASILLVRWLTGPLRRLAQAADGIGRGRTIPVPQDGPEEVRRVARALDAMQARISRLVDDRTQALGAVSHDLRTPITRLRLRAGFLEDREVQARIEEDLDEMEAMISATLAYLQGDLDPEPQQLTDVGALLSTLCDAAADAGQSVSYGGPDHLNLLCRPVALRRTMSNLIGNAVAYAGSAHVILEPLPDGLRVLVEDRGAGIPPEELERVFEPFHRLEGSRNRSTGGVGLGLTISRQAVVEQGGSLTLSNRAGGGLRAVIHLPTVKHGQGGHGGSTPRATKSREGSKHVPT